MTYALIILSFLCLLGWTLLLRVLYHYAVRPDRRGCRARTPASPPLTDDEKRLASAHEAGHAVVAYYVGRIPSGLSIEENRLGLAATFFEPEGQRNRTREGIRHDIAILLAGRLAEEALLGETTSSCIHDLRNVRFLAREATVTLGMGKRTGLVSYEDTPEQIMQLSERTREEIEDDIRDEIGTGAEIARRILSDHQPDVERLARLLYGKGTLNASDIRDALTP